MPWTPQQAAQRARVGAAVTPTEGVNVVWARESIPAGPSIFLAGPTPADGEVPSERPSAIAALKSRWPAPERLTVLTPESRLGERAKEYHDQLEWEAAALDAATAIIFWIPRDLDKLPGLTTNVEFGLHLRSGRWCSALRRTCPNPERNRYLIWTARRHGAPVCETLAATVATAIAMIAPVRDQPDSGQRRSAAFPAPTGARSQPQPTGAPGRPSAAPHGTHLR